MKNPLLLLVCLLAGAPALASAPQRKHPQPQELAPKSRQASMPTSLTGNRQRVPPCQGQTLQRSVWPQGALLWGTRRKEIAEETSSVLSSVAMSGVQLGGTALKGVRIEDGRLVASSVEPEGLVGAVFQGTASDGQSVEVALCGADPTTKNQPMTWYHIEFWNAQSGAWENPCVATTRVPTPRALAVPGIWDEAGARHEVPEKFTFACESGVIAKCTQWGYRPWAKKNGRSLADLHQACTRMARADYCGDGRSHTRENNLIDMYDSLEVITRTTEASQSWAPERASFEAAWAPDGAWCLARTREGQAVEKILEQCPDRFEVGVEDLGGGDRCTVRRKSGHAGSALLRNRSYSKGEQLLQESTP
ncbi:hypothetical protein F0U60_02675 [Archangium minus]|uniref:ADYC domain-containing protein n=2 Tax=Archangium minus TaxID=83450 RepID=A0ABY9WIL0_9BACT|nr:hypothetical protein F0U60_02675 [Archangium minus]